MNWTRKWRSRRERQVVIDRAAAAQMYQLCSLMHDHDKAPFPTFEEFQRDGYKIEAPA